MNPEGKIQLKPEMISEENLLKYTSLRYGIIRQPQMEKAEKDFIDNLLVNFKMNVSALNNYLECPVKFYYSTLIRVPSAVNESAQFGTSMHDALNFYFKKMMADKTYPPESLLLNRFEWHINENRSVFTAESLKRFRDYGIQCLHAFFQKYFTSGTKGDFIRTEVPMEAVVNGIPLKGFADKLHYLNEGITITDFKTGSLVKANGRFEFAEPGHEKKPEGGNYWRQAVMYKILFDHQRNQTKQLRDIEFHFIEPNASGDFDIKKVLVTPEHEKIVMQQAEETWAKIQTHEFYTGCGKPDCEWCNFVKEHKLYISLLEAEEVSEDDGLYAVYSENV
jgi:DNA helicase-2/ATP-dependent DNA helicase PcrA